MRWLFLFLGALSLVVFAREARAFDVDDEKGGFHISLPPQPGLTCIAWPQGHTDAAGCAGLDVSKFESLGSLSKAAPPIAVVLLRDSDVVLLVTVLRQDARSSHELNQPVVDEFSEGVAKGMRERLTGATVTVDDKRIVTRSGLQMADLRVTSTGGPEALEALFAHARYFEIPTDGPTYTLAISSGPKGASKLDALSDAMLATLKANKPKPSASKARDDDDDTDTDTKTDHGSSSKAFREGEQFGRILGYCVFGGGIVFVIYWVARRKTPPRQGPGAWRQPGPGQWPQAPGPHGPWPQGPNPHAPWPQQPGPSQQAPQAQWQQQPNPAEWQQQQPLGQQQQPLGQQQPQPPSSSGPHPNPPPFDPSNGSQG